MTVPLDTAGARELDRRGTIPLWMQLLADLRRRLGAGEFATAFPGELALVAEYRVSRHTVREAVRRLDLGTPSEVAELFTDDGVWEWPAGGRHVQGREELARYFGSRPADRLSRRLCTNVLVTVRSPDHAGATSYFTTYRIDGWTGDLQSPPAPTLSALIPGV